MRQELQQTVSDIDSIKRQIGKPFSKAAELEAARKSLAEVEKSLKESEKPKAEDVTTDRNSLTLAIRESLMTDRYSTLFDESKHPRDHGKFTAKGVQGMQMGLFDQDASGQKSLFNVMPQPKKGRKKPAAVSNVDEVTASVSGKLKELLKSKETVSPADKFNVVQDDSLPGQRSLFSRARAGDRYALRQLAAIFVEHYDMPGQKDLLTGETRRSAKTQGKLRWVTIGGHSDGDKQHAGGQAVLIDGDGNIVGGNVPKNWQGKPVQTAHKTEEAKDTRTPAERAGSAENRKWAENYYGNTVGASVLEDFKNGNVRTIDADAAAQRAKDRQNAKAEQSAGVNLSVKQLSNNRWYAMAELPNGQQVTRSDTDKDKAIALATKDIEAAGHSVTANEHGSPRSLTETMQKGEAQKPSSSTDGAPDVGFQDPGFETSPALSGREAQIEQETQREARENWPQIRARYLKRNGTFDENGKLTSVQLNTDDWRDLFPVYNGLNANLVHEASSYLNKRMLDEAIKTMKGVGNNTVLVLAGGGGSGKGTATKGVINMHEYPIVVDQVSDSVQKAYGKILNPAKDNGYSREVVFVDRHPESAWKEGVVTRALNSRKRGAPARTVPLHVAVKANIEARNATLKMLRDDPDLPISVIDNNNGPGMAIHLKDREEAIAFLAGQDHDYETLRGKLHAHTSRVHQYGQIPDDIAASLLGGSENADPHGRVQSGSTDRGDRGVAATERQAAGSAAGIEGKGAAHAASGERTAGAGESLQRGIPKPGAAGLMKASQLKRDPHKFQYKLNVNQDGVTSQFKDVKFNPALAGRLSVWQDPQSGETYVVNGHHRHELAERSGYDDDLTVFHLEAKNEKEARALGALANIAGGQGTAIDAAKFLRDTNSTTDQLQEHGVSLTKGLTQDALTLAKLSPRIFDKVATGTYRQGRALAIGQHLADFGDQEQLDRMIDQREQSQSRDIPDHVVGEMARQMALSNRIKAGPQQPGLFGDEPEERNTLVERAQVTSAIRRSITSRLNKFRAVSNEKAAETLSSHNQIDAGANRQQAKTLAGTLDDFDRESVYRGPVGNIINRAAEELANDPRREREIVSKAQEEVFAHLGTVSAADGRGQGETLSAGGEDDRPHRPLPGQRDLLARRFSTGRDAVAAHLISGLRR